MLFNKKHGADDAVQASAIPPPPASPVRSASPVPAKAATRSVVDPWLHITGSLEGDGELQIDGHLRGNVRCTHLIIGSQATVDGDVTADQIVVRGEVKGTVRANYAMLQHGARVEGDIFHKELSIETGARFEGASRRRDNPFAEVQPQAAAATPATAEVAKSDAGESSAGAAASDVVTVDEPLDVPAGAEPAPAADMDPPAPAARTPRVRTPRHVTAELERLRMQQS